MALDVQVGTITCPASAGQLLTVLSFVPKVVLFWYGETGTQDSFVSHCHRGFGWATGTAAKDQYAIGVNADDGLSSNQAKPRFQDDACILMITDANPGVVTIEANLFELFVTTAGGFKLDFVTTVSGVKLHYMAIGGADITNVFDSDFSQGGTTGNVSVTAPAFTPDLTIFLSDGKATSFPGTGGKGLNIGAAISSTERWATSVLDKAQVNKAGKAGGHQKSTKCIIASKGPASVESESDFVSNDTNGFTVNVTTAKNNYNVAYLCIKGDVDNFQAALGVDTQRTSVGTKANTAPSFKPDCLFMVGLNEVTPSSGVTDAKHTIGASDGTNEGCHWAGNLDNPSTLTRADEYDGSAKLFVHATPAFSPTKDAECDLQSFDTNGYTLDWTIADAVAREFCFLVIKGAAAGGATVNFTATAAATASTTGASKATKRFTATASAVVSSTGAVTSRTRFTATANVVTVNGDQGAEPPGSKLSERTYFTASAASVVVTAGVSKATKRFTATANAVAANTGALTTRNYFTATASSVVLTTGALSVTATVQFTASASSVVLTTGALTTRNYFTATASSVVLTTGVRKATIRFTATATSVIFTVGALTTRTRFTATGNAVILTTGALTVGARVQFTASAALVVLTVGVSKATRTFTASAGSVVLTTGVSKATRTFTASAGSVVLTTGVLASRTYFTASAASVVLTVGALTSRTDFKASAVSVVLTVGALTSRTYFTASAGSVVLTAGALTIGAIVPFTATAGSAVLTTGTLTSRTHFIASALAITQTSGISKATKRFTATSSSVVLAVGDLTTRLFFTASASASTVHVGVLSRLREFQAIAASVVLTAGALAATKGFTATANATVTTGAIVSVVTDRRVIVIS